MLEFGSIILIFGFLFLKSRTDEVLNNAWLFQDEIRAEIRKLKQDSEDRHYKILDRLNSLEDVIANNREHVIDRIDYHLDPSEEQIAIKKEILNRRVKTWS